MSVVVFVSLSVMGCGADHGSAFRIVDAEDAEGKGEGAKENPLACLKRATSIFDTTPM